MLSPVQPSASPADLNRYSCQGSSRCSSPRCFHRVYLTNVHERNTKTNVVHGKVTSFALAVLCQRFATTIFVVKGHYMRTWKPSSLRVVCFCRFALRPCYGLWTYQTKNTTHVICFFYLEIPPLITWLWVNILNQTPTEGAMMPSHPFGAKYITSR